MDFDIVEAQGVNIIVMGFNNVMNVFNIVVIGFNIIVRVSNIVSWWELNIIVMVLYYIEYYGQSFTVFVLEFEYTVLAKCIKINSISCREFIWMQIPGHFGYIFSPNTTLRGDPL